MSSSFIFSVVLSLYFIHLYVFSPFSLITHCSADSWTRGDFPLVQLINEYGGLTPVFGVGVTANTAHPVHADGSYNRLHFADIGVTPIPLFVTVLRSPNLWCIRRPPFLSAAAILIFQIFGHSVHSTLANSFSPYSIFNHDWSN